MRCHRSPPTGMAMLACTALLSGALAAETVDDLATRFYHPSEAEQARIGGMSRAAFESRGRRTAEFLERLAAIDRSALSVSDRVDGDYLRAQLDNSLLHLTVLETWKRRPGDYIAFDGFFAATLDEARPLTERYSEMVAALADGVMDFAHGKKNLANPPALWVDRAITLAENTQHYFDRSMPGVIESAPNADLAAALTDAAKRYRAALDDYHTFLRDELRPRASGLLAIGPEAYQRMLGNHFLDYSVDELVAMGRELYDETVALLDETAASIDPTKTWQLLIDENRLDHPAPWALFTTLAAEAERARKLVYEEILDLPPGLGEIYRYVEAGHPATLPRGASGIGPFPFENGSDYVGYYALPSIDQYDTLERRSQLMMDWSRAWFIVQQIPHEVYPGHHLQVFLYDRNERPVRKWVGSAPYTDVSSSMSEGWAVYAEELMWRHGYFHDEPRLFLAHLQHRLWRIARIVLDPQFHNGRIGYEDLVDFFQGTGLTRGQAHVEATQITNIPVHDLGYYVGVVELKALRQAYASAVGEERFDERAFHTDLILRGNVPVSLVREEMLAPFVHEPLDAIDVSGASRGIVAMPDGVAAVIGDVFGRYTRIAAPNGKPIHILVQDAWTEDQIVRARQILEHILTDAPGTEYGSDKTAVANAIADQGAVLTFFDTEEDLEREAPRLVAIGLPFQDLRANECPAEGSDDYMQQMTRDAAFEEILHFVHDYGIVPVLPDYDREMQVGNLAAVAAGYWHPWPPEEPESHHYEYIAAAYDNYLDLWTVEPTRYEGHDLDADDIPDGMSHLGRFGVNSRQRLAERDPTAYALVEKFFPPHLTYQPALPVSFTGTFSLTRDPALRYSAKSQHLVDVALRGAGHASLIGNAKDNRLTGNAGDNLLEGRGGDDELIGGPGSDVAVFRGARDEYLVTRAGDAIRVRHHEPDGDGTDLVRGIETLRFSDLDLDANSAF